MQSASAMNDVSVDESGHASGVHPVDTRTPLYLFRVPELVFDPYEAIGALAVALLRDPSRVARIRYVLDGEVGPRRSDVLRAALARDEGAREMFATDTAFVPVMLRASIEPPGPRERVGGSSLYAAVIRSFVWAGLVPEAAKSELEIVRFLAGLDDEERSLRGELCILVARSGLASHLVFFDDGARELLSVTVPHLAGTAGYPVESALLERVDAVLSRGGRAKS